MNKVIKAPSEDFVNTFSDTKEALKKAFIDDLSELEMYSKQKEVRVSSGVDSTIIVITYDIFGNTLPEGWTGEIRIQGNLYDLRGYSFQITARTPDAFATVAEIEFNDFEKLSLFLFDSKITDLIDAVK